MSNPMIEVAEEYPVIEVADENAEILENPGPIKPIMNTESKNGNQNPSAPPNILILNIFDANSNKVKIHEFCDDQSKLPPYVQLGHLAQQDEMQKVLENVFGRMFARIEDKKVIWMSGKELRGPDQNSANETAPMYKQRPTKQRQNQKISVFPREALLVKLEADNAEKSFHKLQPEINESNLNLEQAQLDRERYEKQHKKHLMKKIDNKQLEAFEDEKLREFLKLVKIERESMKSHQRLAFQYNKAQKEMVQRKEKMKIFWKNMKKREKEIAEKGKDEKDEKDGK